MITPYTVDVYVDPYLPNTRRVQFRFPKSRKRRIRKKWEKDARNWRTEEIYTAFRINGKLVVNEACYRKMQSEVEAERRRELRAAEALRDRASLDRIARERASVPTGCYMEEEGGFDLMG